MRKPEQRLWDSMRKNRPADVWLERVENLVGDGMPDVAVVCAGAWVELKAAKLPKRPTTKVMGKDGLRQSQKNWHKDAAQHGVPCYTLLRDDKRQLYLIPAKHSDDVNEMTQSELAAASVADNWIDIFKELKR